MRPDNFRFRGIDGRGRQELVRDPNNGGAAVIRIDDPKGGSEGYTFDVEWRGGSGGGGGWGGSGGNGPGNNGGGWGNGGNRPGNNGGGWGGSGGSGGGWNGSSGSTFNFRGDGNGYLNRRNGRDQRVRDVNVSLSRDGRVALSFDGEGFQRLNFVGRADRYNRDSIVTELRSGGTRGSATIYMDRRGEVERIEMNGRMGNDDFRLQWRAR